jgi:hypothetical protein
MYLGYWRLELHRRNVQSWESLVARLAPAWSASGLTNHLEGAGAGTRESRGLWEMHRNAGVILEMVDYAERCGELSNSESLEALRSDALQIRIHVLKTLARRFPSQWTHQN